MGDTLSRDQYGANDNEYNIGEARRQIHALWQKYTEMNIDTKSNGKELAEIRVQTNYMVRLLENIDRNNQLSVPRCAERGIELQQLKSDIISLREQSECDRPRIELLEGTQRVLKWAAAIVSAVITAICVKLTTA